MLSCESACSCNPSIQLATLLETIKLQVILHNRMDIESKVVCNRSEKCFHASGSQNRVTRKFSIAALRPWHNLKNC